MSKSKLTVEITAIQLVRIGDKVKVMVESGDKWVEVIEEHHDSYFSHIVEALGIHRQIDKTKL